LKALETLTGLRELELGRTKIGDTGLRHLEKLTRLESLDVALTNVTEGGAESLRKALPHCDIGWK
jgi:hypothetical protein